MPVDSRNIPVFLKVSLLLVFCSSCGPPEKWSTLVDNNSRIALLRVCDELDESENFHSKFLVCSKGNFDYLSMKLQGVSYQFSARFPTFDNSICHVGTDSPNPWSEKEIANLNDERFRELVQSKKVTICNEKYLAYLREADSNQARAFDSLVSSVESLTATFFVFQNEDLLGSYRLLGISLRSFLEYAQLAKIELVEDDEFVKISLAGRIGREFIKSKMDAEGVWNLTYSKQKKSFVEQSENSRIDGMPIQVISNFEFEEVGDGWLPKKSTRTDEYKNNDRETSFTKSCIKRADYTYVKNAGLSRKCCYASFFGLLEPPSGFEITAEKSTSRRFLFGIIVSLFVAICFLGIYFQKRK